MMYIKEMRKNLQCHKQNIFYPSFLYGTAQRKTGRFQVYKQKKGAAADR